MLVGELSDSSLFELLQKYFPENTLHNFYLGNDSNFLNLLILSVVV